MATRSKNIAIICALVRRLAAWTGTQPTPPVIFAAYHQTYSANRPMPCFGLVYQDGDVCPWWRLGNQRHDFPANSLIALSAHDGSRSAPFRGHGGLWVCSFTLAGHPELLAELVAAYRFAPVPIRQPAQLMHAFRQVATAYLMPRPTRPLHLQAALLALFATVLDDLEGESAATDAIGAALTFLVREYRRPELSLPEVAAAAGLSVHHFGRSFRQATGQSPMRYLQELRLRQARALLRDTTLRVNEVARETGFADPLRFSRVFHAAVGCAPRDYRRQ